MLSDFRSSAVIFWLIDFLHSITAVGWEAINTLRDLGHCTVAFNGKTEVDRPGMMELEGPEFTADDLKVGGEITIE